MKTILFHGFYVVLALIMNYFLLLWVAGIHGWALFFSSLGCDLVICAALRSCIQPGWWHWSGFKDYWIVK